MTAVGDRVEPGGDDPSPAPGPGPGTTVSGAGTGPGPLRPETAPPAVVPGRRVDFAAVTPARLALGRAGAGMPTDETLRFGLAHALARDAVHAALDVETLAEGLEADGWSVLRVASEATDRATYLRRPDLGRRLAPADLDRLRAVGPGPDADDHAGAGALAGPRPDLAVVIGDGLSALAAARHARPLLAALKEHLPPTIRFAPVTLATQARVALGDDVGEALGATLCAVLIGERPGLSSPDSLGIYLTHGPRRGRLDAERNCVSNVRPEGLPCAEAAFKLGWLIREALRIGRTGIELKDESDRAVVDAPATSRIAGTASPSA